MYCYHNQQNKSEKTKKKHKFSYKLGTIEHAAFSQRAPKCFIAITVLDKTCRFFSFVFCFVNCGNSTCKSESLRRPHPTCSWGALEHISLTLQQKASPERFYISSTVTSVSKKPSEENAENSFGGRSWVILDILFSYNSHVCDLQRNRIPDPNPQRKCQQERVPERTAPTR